MKGENLFSLGMLYHIAMEHGWNKWWGKMLMKIIGSIPIFNSKLFKFGWRKAGQWFYW